jgi:hypothetical protein
MRSLITFFILLLVNSLCFAQEEVYTTKIKGNDISFAKPNKKNEKKLNLVWSFSDLNKYKLTDELSHRTKTMRTDTVSYWYNDRNEMMGIWNNTDHAKVYQPDNTKIPLLSLENKDDKKIVVLSDLNYYFISQYNIESFKKSLKKKKTEEISFIETKKMANSTVYYYKEEFGTSYKIIYYLEVEVSNEEIYFPNLVLYDMNLDFRDNGISFSKGNLIRYSMYHEDHSMKRSYDLIENKNETYTVKVEDGEIKYKEQSLYR